jgi:hypothetical protein
MLREDSLVAVAIAEIFDFAFLPLGVGDRDGPAEDARHHTGSRRPELDILGVGNQEPLLQGALELHIADRAAVSAFGWPAFGRPGLRRAERGNRDDDNDSGEAGPEKRQEPAEDRWQIL